MDRPVLRFFIGSITISVLYTKSDLFTPRFFNWTGRSGPVLITLLYVFNRINIDIQVTDPEVEFFSFSSRRARTARFFFLQPLSQAPNIIGATAQIVSDSTTPIGRFCRAARCFYRSRACRVLSSAAEAMEPPELKIFNTMSKRKEVFRPRVEGHVGMYVCGVTPYDFSHIGHARAYVAFDVLYRYLKHLGYEVKYVRNFTDIDDKIIRRANEAGEDPFSLSARFSQAFSEDIEGLHCLRPTYEPRVSDHINPIKDLIVKIIENDNAYIIDGDVYFSVDSFPDYGRLSGRKRDDNRAGGGGRVAVDDRKKNPADFALWKSAKPGEPSWDSPWGPGRPGWHIECSAMSSQYLGHSFDIHGGGEDLIFPHHENELAQSCAGCPGSTVSYWMHNGFVNKDNQKMSKSDNNFFTIRDITNKYHPLALRFFLMKTHYRACVNYSDSALERASDLIFDIYQALHDCQSALSRFREATHKHKIPPGIRELIVNFHSNFITSMADDLHTATVLDELGEPLKAINSTLKKLKGEPQASIHALIALEKEVKDILAILGLLWSDPSEMLQQLKAMALKRAELSEEQLMLLIEERNIARKNKDYEKSDMIRKELTTKGIALMDEAKGTAWRPCVPSQDALVKAGLP